MGRDRGKNTYHANACGKKARVAILISGRVDFKPKTVTRDEKGYYIKIKWPIQQVDLKLVNIYATNMEAPEYMK